MHFPGMMLGQRYELEEQVGRGGFSEVWRARDLILDRLVAVKVLHAGRVQYAGIQARFRVKARHAGGLAHENIARVFDYGEPDPPYLVMELTDFGIFHLAGSAGMTSTGLIVGTPGYLAPERVGGARDCPQ